LGDEAEPLAGDTEVPIAIRIIPADFCLIGSWSPVTTPPRQKVHTRNKHVTNIVGPSSNVIGLVDVGTHRTFISVSGTPVLERKFFNLALGVVIISDASRRISFDVI
jgi:hypothetical protein